MDKATNIDQYIAGFPVATRKLLETIRATIRKAAPDAKETINYGIPTFTLNGNLVHFAAFKNHIGFYPAPSGIGHFSKELSIYKGAKGSVQFPMDKALPLALVSKIVRFRVRENVKKSQVKTISKPTTGKNKITEQEQVTDHIKKLEPSLAKVVEAIRKIILGANKSIGERIKWNNPSFYYMGEMKEFDPKDYKRDIAVFNLARGRIMLVLPTGANIKDSSALLEGDYKDGRRIINFTDMADVKLKEKHLRHVIKLWLDSVEK